MKKVLAILTLAACLSLVLCGCDFWMDGNYYSVTPHTGHNTGISPGSTQVTSYSELFRDLSQLIEAGKETGIIYYTGLSHAAIRQFMDLAVGHLISTNPLAAYALDQITYEIGSHSGAPAIAVQLTYIHNRTEILQIQTVQSMEHAAAAIAQALKSCSAGVVLRIKEYEELDFIQLVQDYVEANPQFCMEMPQVSSASFPNAGRERILELSFTYQTSRATLREMQETVIPIFDSARLYISSDADVWQKYTQLYSFLMERFDYTFGTSITPAYHLLHHGVGDSKAFASVYAAMCRQVGLDCQAISGTKAGEPWHWNVMLVDGAYYHIDLIACSEADGFRVYADQDMSDYIWNYSALSIEQ